MCIIHLRKAWSLKTWFKMHTVQFWFMIDILFICTAQEDEGGRCPQEQANTMWIYHHVKRTFFKGTPLLSRSLNKEGCCFTYFVTCLCRRYLRVQAKTSEKVAPPPVKEESRGRRWCWVCLLPCFYRLLNLYPWGSRAVHTYFILTKIARLNKWVGAYNSGRKESARFWL